MLRLLHTCGLPLEDVDFINCDGKTMNKLLQEVRIFFWHADIDSKENNIIPDRLPTYPMILFNEMCNVQLILASFCRILLSFDSFML